MNHKLTIKPRIAAAALALAGAAVLFSACEKKVQRDFPIDNYLSSDSVAKKDIIGHWTFDGTYNEQFSAIPPSEVKNSNFVAGVRGQAVSFSNGYLLYPNIPAVNPASLQQGFTLSAWANVKNNGLYESEIFSLAAPSDVVNYAGDINLSVETDLLDATQKLLIPFGLIESHVNALTTDSFSFYNYADPTDTSSYHLSEVVNGAGIWTHFVLRYSATDTTGVSSIDIFANGKVVSSPLMRAQIFRKMPLGSLNLISPANVVVGTFPTKIHGYGNNDTLQATQGDFHGAIDEIRLYKRALTNSEIQAIYDLESAGR